MSEFFEFQNICMTKPIKFWNPTLLKICPTVLKSTILPSSTHCVFLLKTQFLLYQKKSNPVNAKDECAAYTDLKAIFCALSASICNSCTVFLFI